MVSKISILPEVQRGIDSVNKQIHQSINEFNPDFNAELSSIISTGESRIRSRLIFLIGKMFKTKEEILITLATSIELLHLATLIHNDLIEVASLGNKSYLHKAKWSSAATVLTGDFIFSEAANFAAQTNSIEVMSLFSKTLKTIVNGEVNQLFNNLVLNQEIYLKDIYANTASLFETSTHSAAIISSLDTEKIELMRKFGYEFGMAYKIFDDINKIILEQNNKGRFLHRYLNQGYIPLPLLLFFKAHSDNMLKNEIIRRNKIEKEQVNLLISEIVSSSAIFESRKIGLEFSGRARGFLHQFPSCLQREELESLVDAF